MNTAHFITLARKQIGLGAIMESSARVCLADAVALYDKGDFEFAAKRALKSLAYSVGVYHQDYKAVAAAIAKAEGRS